MKNFYLLFLILVTTLPNCIAQSITPDTNNILYVKQNATGTASGTNWTNAIPELADALQWANNNKGLFTQTNPLKIYVAQGTYYPKYETNNLNQATVTNTFLLSNNMELYGSFDGKNTDLTKRDFINNKTILSGDYLKNDSIGNLPNNGASKKLNYDENVKNIITLNNDPTTIVLDGFIITGANSNGIVSKDDQNNYNSTNINFSISNTTISNTNGSAINLKFLYGELLVNIKDSNLVNNDNGIMLSSSQGDINLNVTNSIITNNTDWGIYATTANRQQKITIIDSEITKNKKGINIPSNSNHEITIEGTSISDNLESALYTKSSNGTLTLTIANSKFISNKQVNFNLETHLNNNITITNTEFTNLDAGVMKITSMRGLVDMSILNSKIINNNIGANNLVTIYSSGIKFNLINSEVSNNQLANNQYLFHLTPQSLNSITFKAINSTLVKNTASTLFYVDTRAKKGYYLDFKNSLIFANEDQNNENSLVYDQSDIDQTLFDFSSKNSLIQGFVNNTNGNLDGTSSYTNQDLFADYDTNDFSLSNNSPLLNKGDNTLYTGTFNTIALNPNTDKDLNDDPRVFNTTIDIGAYEFQPKTITPSANTILYVKQGAKGNGSGSSWAHAIPELADALKWAHNQNKITPWTASNPLKIYVAKGTYYPKYSPADNANFTDKPTNPKSVSFLMVNNVMLYGGFAGTETLLSQRDLKANQTILSGDLNKNDDINIDVNDLYTNLSRADNAYNVVIATTPLVIDGFTITSGNVTKNAVGNVTVNGEKLEIAGGGILASNTLNILNTTVTANSGGGIRALNTTTLTNSTVSANLLSTNTGAGIFSKGIVTLINSVITNNKTDNNFAGGGIYSENEVALTNSAITHNLATNSFGGGIVAKGAITMVNSSINFNSVGLNNNGSAIYSYGFPIKLINSSIISNSGAYTISYSGNPSTKIMVYNSIIYNNSNSKNSLIGEDNNTNLFNVSSDFKNSLVQGYTTTVNNNIPDTHFTLQQLFKNHTTNDYSLAFNSPLLNAGDNALYTGTVGNNTLNINTDQDIAGNPRLFGTTIDIGTYENQCNLSITEIITNVNCYNQNDGTISVIPMGGTAPYTFYWNDGITTAGRTNLYAGNYTVTVTDATGCYAEKSYTIIQPAPIASPTAPTTQAFCSNQNATIASLQATGTAIKWYSSATATTALNTTDLLAPGTYYATQTINGCESVTRTPVTVTLYNITAPVVTSQNFCQAATVANLPQGNGTYTWYATPTGGMPLVGTTPLTSATYYVSETSTNCESSRTPVTVTIGVGDLVKQKWDDVLVFNNTDNKYLAWQWYHEGQAINGATAQYYSAAQPLNGTYFVVATAADGTTIQTCPLTIALAKNIKALVLTPNPVQSGQMLNIRTKYADTELQGAKLIVTDSTGKNVAYITNPKSNTSILAPNTAQVYIVTLILANGKQHTEKFVVN